MKKLVSIFMSTVLMLTMFSITALAATNESGEE